MCSQRRTSRFRGWDTEINFGKKNMLEEKVFVIILGWGQRGKGDHIRFPATELGLNLDLKWSSRDVNLPSITCCPGRIGSLFGSRWLLELGAWMKQVWERKL